ncbi:hypothetical protein ACBY01_13095 [Sphingomonas sp. ac-8]
MTAVWIALGVVFVGAFWTIFAVTLTQRKKAAGETSQSADITRDQD